METRDLKQNIGSCRYWVRLLYMVLFAVVLYVVLMLVGIIAVVQWLFALLGGRPHDDITDFARDLSRYVHQIVAYLTFAEEGRPFPFSDRDDDDDDEEEQVYLADADGPDDVGAQRDDDAPRGG